MLRRLTIDNYALIDKSEIDLHEGFTVITGETGSGKSIMLDALSLLMGARSDSKAMGDRDRKMVVEGIFTQPTPELKQLLEKEEIDWDNNEIIIRREISPSGKSRAFINDTPVNLSVMSEISSGLIDIHTQNSNILLQRQQQQTSIIDAFAKNEEILMEYKKLFQDYVSLRNKIKRYKDNIARNRENEAFITYRLEQLEKLNPKRGELQELEREAEILGEADKIKSDLYQAYNLLEGNSASALKSLAGATTAIENIDIELLDPGNKDHLEERLNNLKIELKDISESIEYYIDKITYDPVKLEKVQSRIDSLYEMMRRMKVKDEDELIDLHEELKKQLISLQDTDSDITELEKQLKESAKSLKDQAEKLTETRREGAERFSSELIEKLKPLGMPNIQFNIEMEKGKLNSEGQDIITFKCSFNKNHPIQPVSEIASGGEISRVILGIKSIMATNMNLPTIIFDEIDTGVSGEIAHRMGLMMKEMSKKIQVMAVTHLPQVAANGINHLKVYKTEKNDKTVSHIQKLNSEERIKEIAGMLSGDKINDIALENAKSLLNSN